MRRVLLLRGPGSVSESDFQKPFFKGSGVLSRGCSRGHGASGVGVDMTEVRKKRRENQKRDVRQASGPAGLRGRARAFSTGPTAGNPLPFLTWDPRRDFYLPKMGFPDLAQEMRVWLGVEGGPGPSREAGSGGVLGQACLLPAPAPQSPHAGDSPARVLGAYWGGDSRIRAPHSVVNP